jgi:hypothetical protein
MADHNAVRGRTNWWNFNYNAEEPVLFTARPFWPDAPGDLLELRRCHSRDPPDLPAITVVRRTTMALKV